MPPRASDLPYDTQRQLLDNIRAQVGAEQYDRMVASMGEEGLLDLVLDQAEQQARADHAGRVAAPSKEEKPWHHVFVEAFWIPYYILLIVSGFGLLIVLIGGFLGWLAQKNLGKMPLYQRYGPPTEVDLGAGAQEVIQVLAGIIAFVVASVVGFPIGLLVFAASYVVVLVIVDIVHLVKALKSRYGR